jgi:hypothetical protein
MRMRTTTPAQLAWLLLFACGGGSQGEDAVRPGPCPECSDQGGGSGQQADSNLISDEKYEEIKATFERKTGTVSRCYVEGVEAGEVDKSEKGHVTVGLTVNPDGTASNVKVMESSFKSGKVGDCVVRMVSGWTFTKLPKPLDTSHTYVLDRL